MWDNGEKRLTNINVRVPTELKTLIENQVQQGLHVNISDFVREAIRNKMHTRKQQSRAHNHLKHFPRTQTEDENDGWNYSPNFLATKTTEKPGVTPQTIPNHFLPTLRSTMQPSRGTLPKLRAHISRRRTHTDQTTAPTSHPTQLMVGETKWKAAPTKKQTTKATPTAQKRLNHRLLPNTMPI